MGRARNYILMYQDFEVASFKVAFGKKNSIEVIEKLEHFDKAPYGMKKAKDQKELNDALFRFFNSRSIATPRWDYEEIIKHTHVRDNFELSFKGHGLSLSNHFWFRKKGENLKYKDINFFTNKWDDSFAKAVLNGNYEALENCDLNVPDIVTQGWGIKGWLCEDSPRLYKLGIDKDHSEESIAEALASELASRLFDEGQFVKYELKMVNGKYASVSKTMISIDEELIPLSIFLPHDLYKIYLSKNKDHSYSKMFMQKLKELGYMKLYDFFVRLACLRSLCFVSDLHFDNLSVIRNLTTGEIRAAPLYDLGGAFGSSRTGKRQLSNINKATYLIVYYIFGGSIDENWDFSWYDPNKLVGFEDKIREFLSKSDFYNEQLIENIIDVYKYQKRMLDEYALKNKS